MLLALLPLLQALAGGASIEAAAAGLSVAQWTSIGLSALSALPSEIQAAQSIHGLLADVIGKVLTAGKAEIASVAVQDWLAANAEKAIQLQPGISSES